MKTFKDWLANVESNVSAEVSTATGDVAGNPYGAGIQHYNQSRDQYGLLKKKKKEVERDGLGGEVLPMRFTGGKPAGTRE